MTAATLTDSVGSGSQTYAGTIEDGTTTATYSGTVGASSYTQTAVAGGQTSFTKAGAGTQILTGADTASGDTTITGGTLSLTGSATITKSRIVDNSVFTVSGPDCR